MALDIARIRGLCFDVDGTLSDTDDRMVESLVKSLSPIRRFFPGRDFRPFARRWVTYIEAPGNFLIGLPDRVGVDDELNRAGQFFRRMGIGGRPPRFMLVPQVKEMLEQLRPRYPMTVVSARDERTTLFFLEQYELLPYFQAVVTAQTVEHTKPYPDPIRYAAERMNVLPEQCLMIGDTTVDVRAGKAAGAQTVGVLCGFGEEPELRRWGADLILPTTALLPQILLGEGFTPSSSDALRQELPEDVDR